MWKMYYIISSNIGYYLTQPPSIYSASKHDKSKKRTLALLFATLFEMYCNMQKAKSKKIIIRLFQSIRHQGSEQVSKPDIHHVDFSFDC